MEVESDFENHCEQYLLGELSEADRQQLEQTYFAKDEFFERYLAVKEDLIDAYTRKELSAEKRTRFEQHFLSSSSRQKRIDETSELIKTVTALHREMPTEVAKKTPLSERLNSFGFQPIVWRVGFAALLVAVIAVAWIVVKQRQSRPSIDGSARETSTPPDALVTSQSPQATPDSNIKNVTPSTSPTTTPKPEVAIKPLPEPSPSQIASLVLIPLSERAPGSSNSLVLGPSSNAVQLTLVFNGSSQDRFEVLVRTVDGQQVLSRRNLKATASGQGRTVTISFASSLLKRQDYIATLNERKANGELETIGDYYFKVERSVPASSPTPVQSTP